MPAFPHLTATEVDNVVTFVTTPAGGRGRGAGGRRSAGAAAALPPDRAHRRS